MSLAGLVTDAAPDMAPAKPKSERCETCRFWQALEQDRQENEDNLIGDCRRRPPRFVPHVFERQAAPVHFSRTASEDERDLYEATRFPLTDADEWCGEFEWLPSLEPFTGI